MLAPRRAVRVAARRVADSQRASKALVEDICPLRRIVRTMFWLLVGIAVVIWWFAQRGRELFVISVRRGRLLVLRGRVPATLLESIREVVASPPIARATIRAGRAEHGARLVCSGDLDGGRIQRLRNIFALYPASRLRAAPPIAQPTLGQMLGIAWLAWWLDRSRWP
jgi:hypothetical protein